MKQDPKELSGFRSMDDAPINDGRNQRDFDEVDTRRFRGDGIVRNEQEDEDNEDSYDGYNFHSSEQFD